MNQAELLSIDKVETEDPFKNLFPISQKTLQAVTAHMHEHGFDVSQPVTVRRKKDSEAIIVIDGHTRLAAARAIGLKEIPAVVMSFEDEETALHYAIHNQRDRRNITDADLLRCIEAVDKLKPRGGDQKSEKSKASSEAIDQGKSAGETAKIVGTSRAKVEKARTVLRKSSSDTKRAVLENKKSINQAYSETKAKRAEATSSTEEGKPNSLPHTPANPNSKPITDEPLLRMLVTVYNRITELKRANWEGCPQETIKVRLQMLLRLVEK